MLRERLIGVHDDVVTGSQAVSGQIAGKEKPARSGLETHTPSEPDGAGDLKATQDGVKRMWGECEKNV